MYRWSAAWSAASLRKVDEFYRVLANGWTGWCTTQTILQWRKSENATDSADAGPRDYRLEEQWSR